MGYVERYKHAACHFTAHYSTMEHTPSEAFFQFMFYYSRLLQLNIRGHWVCQNLQDTISRNSKFVWYL
jgi:hypothetical protein